MSTNGNSQNGDFLLDLLTSSESVRGRIVKSRLAASVSDAMDRASSVRIDPFDHFVSTLDKAISICIAKKDGPDDEHIANNCNKLLDTIRTLRGSKKDECDAVEIADQVRDAILLNQDEYLALLQCTIRVLSGYIIEKNSQLSLANMNAMLISAEWIKMFANTTLWMERLKVKKDARSVLTKYFSGISSANNYPKSPED